MRNTKTAKTLDCQQHLTITLNGVNIYMITEFNHFHGDIIRVFQIGEEPHGTGVDWSFFHGWEMECDTANGRCGVRPFERDSLAYECLWKQLGLDFPPEEPGDYRPSYSDFHLFRRAVLIAGGTCVYTHH